MRLIGETTGYLKGWRTFIVIERRFEISAVAQSGPSQSKTKPRSSDYATQPLHAARIRRASLFKPDTVQPRPQLPPPRRIRVFERHKFPPPVQTRSYCSTGSALLVCRALAEFIKRPRIKSQLERHSRSLVGYTGSPCDVCSVNSAHHTASPWIKGEQ